MEELMLWTVEVEKTLKSLLDCKEIKPVNLKGNQFWIFIGRTGAEAEALILWPPDGKNWIIRKDPDAGKYWRQKRMTWLDDITDSMDMKLSRLQEFGDGQGSLTCLSPWLRMSQTWLNSTECFILLMRLLVHRDINKLT